MCAPASPRHIDGAHQVAASYCRWKDFVSQSLELNRDYYRDCIAEVVATHCPYIATRHAAALLGWGSEVLGNDDERSKRYGWGPRVVLFLTKEDYGVWRQKLSQTLRAHVPLRFQGHPTRVTDPTLGPPQPLESMEGFLQILKWSITP